MNLQPRYKKGDCIGNRYQVHQGLMGGMGEVYLCLDLEKMVPYALKTFQQRYLEQASGLRRAFEQEVLTWVALEKHPNIVRCFYMNTLDNQPFMMLEWVVGEEGKGADLRGWLRQGPLALRQALDFAIDICYGLVHAQKKQPGIVHRDLKPENILIAQGGVAKITDFGLAQIMVQANLEVNGLVMPEDSAAAHPQQSLAAQGGIAGTPPYMPPEQWQPGTALDERADIYAVACVLYEMLTGRPPFAVDIRPTNPAAHQHWLSAWQWQHEHAARPTFSDTIPVSLAELLIDCLARDREQRPQTITHLLVRLRQVYIHLFGQSPIPAPVSSEFSFVDYNNRGNTYQDLGRSEDALADYAQAIRLNPAYATVFFNRGNTYQAFGRYEEALADYAQAIRLNPQYVDTYYNRGVIYATLGQYETALTDYDKTIQLDPQYVGAYINRGLAYQSLGLYEAARADFDLALYFNPQLAEAYNNRGIIYQDLGQFETALVDYNQAIQLNPQYVEAYYNRGTCYGTVGQYEAALGDFNKAIRLNPSLSSAFYNRGNTCQTLGRYEEALADYAQAIRLNPADANAYTERGNTCQTLGRYEEALADYAQAVRLNSAHAHAFYNRGNTYAILSRYEEALADYTQAIRVNPAHAPIYTNRGLTYHTLGWYEKALADYAQATRLDPANASTFNNQGNTYQHLSRYEEALANYTQAIRVNPAYTDAFYNRGLTHQILERYEEALSDYAQAIRLNPHLTAAYYNRGSIHQKLGQYEEALADYAQVISLNPEDAKAYLTMGAWLGNRGQFREALSYFERAAALGEPIGAQYASQARRKLGETPSQTANSEQQAFVAFQQATSPTAMAQAVAQYPFMVDKAFMATVEQVITQQVPPEHRPAFEQRLTWLRQIAAKQ